ncbi:MAG: 2Fe-2S iron-sulfur cluster-binding protein [Halobacteriales archaeon]
MAISTLGFALGISLLILTVLVHYSRGSGWEPTGDIADEIMARRAETVPETEFPEPANRAVGGGGAAAIPAGEAAELEDVEAEDGEEDGPWALPDEEADTFEVEYVKAGTTIEVRENETLLEAGEDEGWDLPYACREGQCISCGAHTPNGPADELVVHDGNQMLGEAELGDGYMLTCCAYPQDDFALETRESP